MGLFWDLMQQSQISDQKERASSLEDRVEYLEKELRHTRLVVHDLVMLLEHKFGQDLNNDGKIG